MTLLNFSSLSEGFISLSEGQSKQELTSAEETTALVRGELVIALVVVGALVEEIGQRRRNLDTLRRCRRRRNGELRLVQYALPHVHQVGGA